MKQKIAEKNGLGRIVAVCLALSLWPVATSEAVTVDGVITAGEGYSVILMNLDFTVEGKHGDPEIPGAGAKLYLLEDAGSVFVGLSLPKTLVDNSYGTTAIGWGSKDHKFDELVGSDKAQFVFGDVNGVVLDVTLDYLDAITTKGGKKEPDITTYVADKTAKDFEVAKGNPAHILALSTSLFYNWETFGAGYPAFFGKDKNSPAADPDYGNPTLAGWVYDVMYEFQIDLAAFAGSTLDLTSGDFIEIVHASPNKIGGNRVYDFKVIPNPVVPEPLTLASLGLSLLALGGYVRRRFA
ncbi:MAG TPA: PEP-CTERM sorting domain-containing protein [Phycisphaerae bacterium]|nr:PEP-CTERM sorting domain-containing protein [Phycisphaerae bacterium]